ncbi:hypothetical protein [Dongia sp.]|uniref:hypothetical protein n=1 Tax=Dongia sp. TaxID=1977262 RepID=UPI0035AF99D6
MRYPFFRCRVSDLDEGDIVNVTCRRCGHSGTLTRAQLLSKVRSQKLKMNSITADTFIKNLGRNLTCWPCAKEGVFHDDYEISITPINPPPENPDVIRLKNTQLERMKGESDAKFLRRIRNA